MLVISGAEEACLISSGVDISLDTKVPGNEETMVFSNVCNRFWCIIHSLISTPPLCTRRLRLFKALSRFYG